MIDPKQGPATVGLFAGIGGIELGLHEAGYDTKLLCEIDAAARAVLDKHFDAKCEFDVMQLEELPEAEVCAAGFPCQDLSQAGRTAGIQGSRSGVVSRIFELLARHSDHPRWLLLENVPFMLRLDRGNAMRYLTHSLEALGFRWAYRVVDTRAFGLPQRRKRVLLLASRTEDPREVLFHGDEGEPQTLDEDHAAYGFYWTEGLRGLGWARNAIPTLKGGSSLGIPSPPAIWIPGERRIVTPSVEDAERLQGFDSRWTEPADGLGRTRRGARWRLLGNAVSVPVAGWVGKRLLDPQPFSLGTNGLRPSSPWPVAAWGESGTAYGVDLSDFPVRQPMQDLLDVVKSRRLLSERATAGFLERTSRSNLRFPSGFLEDVVHHLDQMRVADVAA